MKSKKPKRKRTLKASRRLQVHKTIRDGRGPIEAVVDLDESPVRMTISITGERLAADEPLKDAVIEVLLLLGRPPKPTPRGRVRYPGIVTDGSPDFRQPPLKSPRKKKR